MGQLHKLVPAKRCGFFDFAVDGELVGVKFYLGINGFDAGMINAPAQNVVGDCLIRRKPIFFVKRQKQKKSPTRRASGLDKNVTVNEQNTIGI